MRGLPEAFGCRSRKTAPSGLYGHELIQNRGSDYDDFESNLGIALLPFASGEVDRKPSIVDLASVENSTTFYDIYKSAKLMI